MKKFENFKMDECENLPAAQSHNSAKGQINNLNTILKNIHLKICEKKL